MKRLKKISFLIENFGLQTPAQQLLDRFLLGYPRGGEHHRLDDCQISVFLSDSNRNPDLDRRTTDFGLKRVSNIKSAIDASDGVVIVPKSSSPFPNEDLIKESLGQLPLGAACFVYGVVGSTLEGGKRIAELASKRKVLLLAGTALPVTWRLPQIELKRGIRAEEALIVVQGPLPSAELDAVDGLLPIIERRRGGESGVRSIQRLKGADVWQAGHDGVWSWSLLASALSRSNTPQGEPILDGRTQDLVGLGLVPGLATDPRGWVVEHFDGLRSVILVLDGVVTDYNFAIRAAENVISAQIYRPPAPAQHQFSRLAETIENYFLTREPPWSIRRNLLTAGLIEQFASSAIQPRVPIQTPQLRIRYSG